MTRTLDDCLNRLTKSEGQSATLILFLKEVSQRLSAIEEKLKMRVSMRPTDPHGDEGTPCEHNLAGEDDNIKMIATVDSSISIVLKGHNSSVTDQAFNPKNEFLASIDGFGIVKYWEHSFGKLVHTLKLVDPNCDFKCLTTESSFLSPGEEILVVSDLKNVIAMYNRAIAEKVFTLKEDHEKLVCFVDWSSNGKYIRVKEG